MTSTELYNKIKPIKTIKYPAQYGCGRLNVNLSDIFSLYVKEAARCNGYNSDVYYNMRELDEVFNNFDPKKDFTPLWTGFRRLGVDGNAYTLLTAEGAHVNYDLSTRYFALYSVNVEDEGDGFYKVILNQYGV